MSRHSRIVLAACLAATLGTLAGAASSSSATTGTQTPTSTGRVWASVTGGRQYSCGIQRDQTLWCWGNNDYGQLGIGGTANQQPAPEQVGHATDWARASAGDDHTCAIRVDHTLWCWGDNRSGELGLGNDSNFHHRPAQVGTDANWRFVSAGGQHTCATKTDHTLWCWGYNHTGQLGIGTRHRQLSPVEVGAATDWSRVDTGFAHTCSTRTDHSLWCWGDNHLGQLGLGDTVDRTIPTRVGTAATWTQVSLGWGHSCAATIDHTLWCWGDNYWGELGLGDTESRTAPAQVAPAIHWAAVGAHSAYAHTCAVATDHTLWCWGRNSKGQLGLGDTTERTVPTRVGASRTWSQPGTGAEHTCAARTSQTLWCWGADSAGQLGVGGGPRRLVPTRV